MKKILAALLTTALLSTSSLIAADESAAAAAQPTQTLRNSIARAVALAVATDAGSTSRADHSDSQMAAGGGRGGGHSMAIVWTLVGSALSVGATVYYLKYMRKTMADVTNQK